MNGSLPSVKKDVKEDKKKNLKLKNNLLSFLMIFFGKQRRLPAFIGFHSLTNKQHRGSKKERKGERREIRYVVKWRRRIKQKVGQLQNVDHVQQEALTEDRKVPELEGTVLMIVALKEEIGLKDLQIEAGKDPLHLTKRRTKAPV